MRHHFYKNKPGKWDSKRLRWIATHDRMKVYRNVTIKYRGTFDAYTISIRSRDD